MSKSEPETRAAVDRVRTFIAAREHHAAPMRAAEKRGGSRNIVPNRIIAQYGYLDMTDLAAICDALDPTGAP